MSTEGPTSDPPPTVRRNENPYASSRVSERPDLGRVSVLAIVGIVIATAASSFVAFCCTCFPIGLVTFDLNSSGEAGMSLAVGGGFVAAAVVGFLVARALWRRVKLY
jgi:hypothetical protein